MHCILLRKYIQLRTRQNWNIARQPSFCRR